MRILQGNLLQSVKVKELEKLGQDKDQRKETQTWLKRKLYLGHYNGQVKVQTWIPLKFCGNVGKWELTHIQPSWRTWSQKVLWQIPKRVPTGKNKVIKEPRWFFQVLVRRGLKKNDDMVFKVFFFVCSFFVFSSSDDKYILTSHIYFESKISLL